MQTVIKLLKEKREIYINSFVKDSIFVHRSVGSTPIPDTKGSLEMIIELNEAISTLENAEAYKTPTSNH